MRHLSNYHSSQPLFGERKIIISDTPRYATGLDFTHHTRLFFFKNRPERFLVDFTEQSLEKSTVCLIPSTHLHFLSPRENCRFFCVDIHDSLFSNRELQYIHTLKFLKQKSLRLSIEESNLFSTLEELWDAPFDEKYYLDYFKNLIVQEQVNSIANRITLANAILINRFLEHIKQIELKLDNCIVAEIATSLSCSERTLQRACISSFGITTHEVIKYHILLKGIYMLCKRELPISAIASQLGFSSVSAFDKCIKRLTNTTPKAIQHYLHSVGL